MSEIPEPLEEADHERQVVRRERMETDVTVLGSRGDPAHDWTHDHRLEVRLSQKDLRVLMSGLPVTVQVIQSDTSRAGTSGGSDVYDVVVRPEG